MIDTSNFRRRHTLDYYFGLKCNFRIILNSTSEIIQCECGRMLKEILENLFGTVDKSVVLSRCSIFVC
jgi:hypothetical protein